LAPQPRLIVSFTADDTYAEQFTTMAPILEAHGMRGTMMVNAGRIDLPGNLFLTTEQIVALQAVGHEIGSHGLTHQHLVVTQNLPDRIEREVCDSRADLLLRGFRVRTIAYPFGEVDGLAQSWAAKCGYTTGRGVGSLSPNTFLWAETIPPKDAHLLRAASSINSLIPIDVAESYVANAESCANGVTPSWLILNFHRFCPGAVCNPGLAWDTDTFVQFIDWVAARKPLGTVVRTISQVAPGPLMPAVRSNTPLVLNGDLESNLQGPAAPPDCWMWGHSGENTPTWTQVAGRTGYGQQLVVSDYLNGSNSLLLSHGSTASPDYKSCGIPVSPGRHYELSCWFKSDVPVAFTLYKNDDYNDVVSPWMTTDASPASPSDWVQKTFGVTIPDGIVKYNTLFYGPYVTSVCPSGCLNGDNTATVVVDDCSAVDDTGLVDGEP
jgi:peptidoglycan/xylan/chitin deacetylase (PgdA/CDA1 family)